jgi:hypothetical protein
MMLPVEVVMAASTGSISPKYMAQFKRNGWLSFRGTVAQSGRNIHHSAYLADFSFDKS